MTKFRDEFIATHTAHGWTLVPEGELRYPFIADTHDEFRCPPPCNGWFTVKRPQPTQPT